MVFPRVNFKPHMLNGAPTATLGLANPSGWMKSDLFVSVMKHFIHHSGCSKKSPTLLILDNHDSHLSVETLNLAKDTGVIMLTLPPHCSNKLPPLDVSIFAPFKTYYNSAIDSWMMRNPGIPVTIYQAAECVGSAFDKSTSSNIKSGFKKCGILRFDRHIFDESDFLMSSVTDREEPPQDKRDTLPEEATSNNTDSVVKETTKNERFSNILSQKENNIQEQKGGFKSPKQIFGYPKALPRKAGKVRRKGRSKLVTVTPEKMEIEQKENEKKRKASLKRAKGTKRKLISTKKAEVQLSSSDNSDNVFVSDSSDAESLS